MKCLLLILIFIVCCLPLARAQSNDWFKGTWYGEKTFSRSRVAVKALIRMEIDAVRGSLFTGRLIYRYPSDTSARLIQRIGGELEDKQVTIVSSEEIYRDDPRSHGFWSDCSQCTGASVFYIQNGNFVLRITTSGCGDSCDGETIFSRKMQDYDAGMQAAVIKQFGTGRAPILLAAYVAAATDTSGAPPASRKDSLKVFPNLLNDSMRVSFDPDKYKTLKPLSIDSAVAAIANKTAKQTKAQPKNTPVRDSVVSNKSGIHTSTADSIAVSKSNTLVADKTAQKKVVQPPATAAGAAINAAQKNTPALQDTAMTASPAKDTIAAASTPVKDTVPAAIAQRTTSLITTYQVSSPHISIQLFDDGQIDGDAVSVYYNGKVVINNQTLTHKAITFNIDASAASRHHEFILISESEGFLPPNTALMRIKAGSQQFELTVSSSSARNAKIAIDYTGE